MNMYIYFFFTEKNCLKNAISVIKELRRDKMIDYGKWEGMGRKFGNKWEGNLVSRQQS